MSHNNVTQRFDEVKAEFETLQTTISRITKKQINLQQQLSRLNLVHQIQKHGVARRTPIWYVNGRGLQINPNR